MPSNFVVIDTSSKLYQTFRKLQDSAAAITQLKVRMDSILGNPADYAALAASYKLTQAQATALYSTVQSMNTTLAGLPFSSIKDYDQEA